jgi:hypothetical protein
VPGIASRPIAVTPRSSCACRARELSFVVAPTPQTEGLRDLLRCREDLRCARTAARHRVSKQLLRHGRVYRDAKTQWTKTHRAWIARQRLHDQLAHAALEQMLIFLDGLDRQLAALDAELEQIAQGERWREQVTVLRLQACYGKPPLTRGPSTSRGAGARGRGGSRVAGSACRGRPVVP